MLKHYYNKGIKMVIGAVATATVFGGLAYGNHLNNSNALTSFSVQGGRNDLIPIESMQVNEPIYELLLNQEVVGYLNHKGLTSNLIETTKETIIQKIGYTPEFEYTLDVRGVSSDTAEASDELDLRAAVEASLYDSIGEIMVKACILKIDDFTVVLADQKALTDVLEAVQSLYVQDGTAITVSLKSDEHNPLVMRPEVNILSKELPDERTFVTSVMNGQPMENLEASDDEFLEAVVTDVKLEQELIVVESFVFASEITDVATATEMISQEHAKEKTYKVVSGDVPSIIAEKNSMTTSALYELNPGLQENTKRIQIGDELTVMVPEPELFVKTVEDVIYTEIIDRDVKYVNDPDSFIGSYSVLEAGADGIIEIRATVEKLNGNIVEEVITGQKTILKPVTETQYRGVKALPVTTATGTFEVPMLTYRYTSDYGYRWGRLHKGIDLAASVGTAIKASDGGRVILAGWDGGYGYSIEIDHGKGMVTKYAHLSKIYVSVGEEVSQYKTIGAVGNTGNSTGPHLHFEILKNNSPVNPENYITP